MFLKDCFLSQYYFITVRIERTTKSGNRDRVCQEKNQKKPPTRWGAFLSTRY